MAIYLSRTKKRICNRDIPDAQDRNKKKKMLHGVGFKGKLIITNGQQVSTLKRFNCSVGIGSLDSSPHCSAIAEAKPV